VTRSREFPRRSRPSLPLRPQLIRPGFRRAAGYYALDPRPCPPYASRCSRETPPSASLGQADAQRLLQLHFRRTDTLPSIRFSRKPERPALCGDLGLAFVLHRAFYGMAAFPCRRRIAKAASRDNPFETAPPALQARKKVLPRMPPPDRDAACGQRLDPTTVCGGGRWTTTLDCTGQVTLSEGPSLPPPAAAGQRG